MEDINKEVTKESGEESRETAEQFKNRIDNYFIEFGLDLSSIPSVYATEKFQEWKQKRHEETSEWGVPLTKRVIFRIELAYAYILLAEKDEYANLAWEEIDEILHVLQYEIDNQRLKEQQLIETRELLESFKNLLTKIKNRDE